MAPVRPLLAVILLLIAALTAGSAAAATSTVVAGAPGSATSGTISAPTASAASVPAPETTAAGPSGGSPSQAGQSAILYSAPAPAGPSAVAGEVRAQPAVIAAGSSSAPLGHPTRSPGGSASGSTVSRPSADQPIVSTTHNASPDVRPAVAQLSSGGPLVAASGSPAPVAARAPRGASPFRGFAAPTVTVPRFVAAPAAVMAVSVPLVGVYISTATSARHPGQKPSVAPVDPVGPAGLPAATVTAFGTGPLERPSGMTPLYGSAPFSSSGGGMAPLIQLSAVLAAITLLAGMSWRRRSWDLPVLQGESALLATALDRPG